MRPGSLQLSCGSCAPVLHGRKKPLMESFQTDSRCALSQSPSTLLSAFRTWFQVLLDLATFFFLLRRQFCELFDLFHFPKALHEIRSLLQPFLQCDWTCLRFIVISCLVTWALLSHIIGGVLNIEVLTLGPNRITTNTVWLEKKIIVFHSIGAFPSIECNYSR